MAHDGPRRCAAANCPETSARESRGVSRARRAGRQITVKRIGLKRRRSCTFCTPYRCRDQRRSNALPAITLAHIKTRDRPDGHIIHSPEPPGPIEPRQRVAGRKLAPPDRQVAIESQQARRRARFTTSRNAALFLWRGFLRYALPIRQYMHQQPLQAPLSPKRSSSSGQSLGVSARILSFVTGRHPPGLRRRAHVYN
jgi:hypothetical protein